MVRDPAPVIWFTLALNFVVCGMILRRDELSKQTQHERRGWAGLAVILVLAALLGPDSFGANHGEYLHQRLVLFGLVVLLQVLDLGSHARSREEPRGVTGPEQLTLGLPTLRVNAPPPVSLPLGGVAGRDRGANHSRTSLGSFAGIALGIALVVQSALIWDYALILGQGRGWLDARTAGRWASPARGDALGEHPRLLPRQPVDPCRLPVRPRHGEHHLVQLRDPVLLLPRPLRPGD